MNKVKINDWVVVTAAIHNSSRVKFGHIVRLVQIDSHCDDGLPYRITDETGKYGGYERKWCHDVRKATQAEIDSVLGTELKFPRKMLVWFYEESEAEETYVVFISDDAKADDPVFAVHPSNVEEYERGGNYCTCLYRHAKEPPQQTEVELSIKEIAEKFNLSVEQVRNIASDMRQL